MSAHLCAVPGCTTILEAGPGRCAEHMGPGRSGTQGYGSRSWRNVRNAYIRTHPWCERCGRAGLDVHHIDGRHPSQPRANDWANLQTLCRSCHRRETEDSKR